MALWLTLACAASTSCFSKEPAVETASQSEPLAIVDVGYRVFDRLRCGACHSLDGRVLAAPTLKGLYGKPIVLSNGKTLIADDEYIRRSILDPKKELVRGYPPSMVSYEGQVTRNEIDALIAMIRSLGEAPDRTGATE